MKKIFISALLAVLVLNFGASGVFAAEPDTVTYAALGDLRSLDPLLSSDNVTANVLLQMYDTLVYIAPSGQLEPMLAERWEQPTPTSYLFYIKQGVKFHNGDECTAEDVKFTLDRAQTPVGVVAHALIKDMDSVEVVDKYTVRINMKRPVTPFLFALGESWAGIVSKKAVEAETHLSDPVGTGPFKYVSWRKSDRIILERFDGYHGQKPNFKNLVIRPVPEASSRTIELQSGAVNVATYIHFSDFTRIEEDPGLKLMRAPSNRVEYIILNVQKPELSDVRVRKAIQMALDIPAMQESVYRGVGFVTGSPLPPGMQYSLKDKAPMPVQDIEGAKKLLAEAGVEDLELELVIFEHKERMDAAVIIQSMLEEIGIHVSIKVMEMGAFYESVPKGEFDISLSGWGNNLPDAEYFFGRTLHSASIGANNYSRYSNPEFDALLDRGLTVPEGQERADIYAKVQQIILDDVPVIFWSVGEVVTGISAKIENFEMDPRNMYRLWLIDLKE